MSLLNEAQFKNIVRAGSGGVYILCGDEGYLIRYYRDLVRAPFTSGTETSFDYIAIPYTSREDADLIVSSAASMPLFSAAGRKLIEISVESPGALPSGDMDALCEALTESAEYEENIVIWCISPGTLDFGAPPKRPSEIYKRLSSLEGVGFVYFPETTPAQLRRWIERHFTHEGLTPDYDTADALLTRSGTEMIVLASEIDKLTAYVKSRGGKSVTAADVAAVCCRVDKYDAFSLSNAILDGRREDALTALEDERRRRTDPIVVSAGISRVIADILSVKLLTERGAPPSEIAGRLGMHEYKVKLYMRAAANRSVEALERAMLECAEADIRLKSSGMGYAALERLICAIEN